MKLNIIGALALLALTSLAHPAWSKDARKDVLQSCAQQAKDQSLAGDANAAFMRDCLKMPDDAKPPAFASSGPQAVASKPASKPDKKPRKPA